MLTISLIAVGVTALARVRHPLELSPFSEQFIRVVEGLNGQEGSAIRLKMSRHLSGLTGRVYLLECPTTLLRLLKLMSGKLVCPEVASEYEPYHVIGEYFSNAADDDQYDQLQAIAMAEKCSVLSGNRAKVCSDLRSSEFLPPFENIIDACFSEQMERRRNNGTFR